MYQTDWIKGLSRPTKREAKTKAEYKATWWATNRERLNATRRERRRQSPEQRLKEKQYRDARQSLKHKKEQPCPQRNHDDKSTTSAP